MDNEVKGSHGTQYDYGFRIYDPRVARFLSVDPLFKSFPFYTPYQFAANTPISAIDLDGLEALITVTGNYWNEKISNAVNDDNITRAVWLATKATNTGLGDLETNLDRAYAENKGGWKGGVPATFNLSEQNPDGLTVVFSDKEGVQRSFNIPFESNQKGKVADEGKMFFHGDEFWDVEPTHTYEDAKGEITDRVVGIVGDQIEDLVTGKGGGGKSPVMIDANGLLEKKIKFAARARLRTLGSGSTFAMPVLDSDGNKVGVYTLQYNVDDKGNESFTEDTWIPESNVSDNES